MLAIAHTAAVAVASRHGFGFRNSLAPFKLLKGGYAGEYYGDY